MKSLLNRIGIFASALALLSFVVVKDNEGLKIGSKATLTDVKMDAIDGKSYSLSDLKKENGLLVVFSCNTCPFVVGSENFAGWEKQYNDLNRLAISQGVGMVLVNSNEGKRDGDDSMAEMKNHAEAANYSMPYLVDKESKLADAYGAKTTPHVYLFDKNMNLVFVGSIDNSWDTGRKKEETYLINALNQMASGKIKVTESEPRGCSIKRVSAK